MEAGACGCQHTAWWPQAASSFHNPRALALALRAVLGWAAGSSSKASLKTTVAFSGKLSRLKRNEKTCIPDASVTDSALVVSARSTHG